MSAHNDNGDEHCSDHLSEGGEKDYNFIPTKNLLPTKNPSTLCFVNVPFFFYWVR